MSYETVKSFILTVLVGISLLLSFILWSYQPNYEYFYDASYVNEVDIGGTEKTKSELIRPSKVVFHHEDGLYGFVDPSDQSAFYKRLSGWVLYDITEKDATGRLEDDTYVEVVYPSEVPAGVITSLFSFNDNVELPDWSFERVFISLDENQRSLKVMFLSIDGRKQITATIDKSTRYDSLLAQITSQDKLQPYMQVGMLSKPIYLPKENIELSKKTLIANNIQPELFINALFSNPSLVTPNTGEAYFTDGQRGMRILQDGRKLEFINPIQSSFERINPIDLIDISSNHINEHKGWTNDYLLDHIDKSTNNIRYQLYYEGYPVFDNKKETIIEQQWRKQELHQYVRPLIRMTNLLNSTKVELLSGEKIVSYLNKENRINLESIEDIRIGYSLSYAADSYSLTLDPSWYYLYQDDWQKIDMTTSGTVEDIQGGD